METYYKKVEIHSEKDLPKEDDVYIVCTNNENPYYHTSFRGFTKGQSEKRWINAIFWYLQPISEAEQREELRKELIKFLNDTDFDITYGLLNNEEIVDEYLKQK